MAEGVQDAKGSVGGTAESDPERYRGFRRRHGHAVARGGLLKVGGGGPSRVGGGVFRGRREGVAGVNGDGPRDGG
jgi:hypothetical protein